MTYTLFQLFSILFMVGRIACIGNFQGFTTDQVGVTDVVDQDATDNTVNEILDVANAGNRVFFSQGSSITKQSDFTFNQDASLNEAISNQNTAVSGNQLVLDDINKKSVVKQNSNAQGNEASVIGLYQQVEDPIAISGTQTQIQDIKKRSKFIQNADASENIASNDNLGDATAGVDTSIGSVRKSRVKNDNSAFDNFSETENGTSIAGTWNNVYSVFLSNVKFESTTAYNQAEAEYGDAIAGTENNFGSIEGKETGGSSKVVTKGTATNNTAVSLNDGKAIAGFVTNVDSISDSSLNVDAGASDNTAVVKGTSDVPKDSVAGVAVNINDAQDSSVTIVSDTENNRAFNYNQDDTGSLSNDAIAGLQVVIGNATGSEIVVVGDAVNNTAFAVNGDAVAGNKVFVGYGASDQLTTSLTASGNNATSINGDAIITRGEPVPVFSVYLLSVYLYFDQHHTVPVSVSPNT